MHEKWSNAIPSSNVKQLWGVVLFFAWLMVTVLAFWWFQYKDLRNFSDEQWQERAVHFQGEILQVALQNDLSGLLKPGELTVVNFIRPGCNCNKYNLAHLQELKQRFPVKVNFVHLLSAQQKGQAQQLQKEGMAVRVSMGLSPDMIPAAPAAAVLDSSGKLAYFGPYSSGAVCGQGKNLVEGIIEDALIGSVRNWLNTRAYGCFCNW